MGAVASLFYLNNYKKDPRVVGLILDSPFSDFVAICNYHAKSLSFLNIMV